MVSIYATSGAALFRGFLAGLLLTGVYVLLQSFSDDAQIPIDWARLNVVEFGFWLVLGVIFLAMVVVPLQIIGVLCFGLPLMYLFRRHLAAADSCWIAALAGCGIEAFLFYAFEVWLKSNDVSLPLALGFGVAFGATTGYDWVRGVQRPLSRGSA